MFNDTTKNYIAIIGDSYIEGLHTSIESSIGRRIEKKLNKNNIEVHEYGISGWNVYNYLELAKSLQDKYHSIYILLAETDLMGGVPSRAKVTGTPNLPRKIYNRSHILRYLNINRGVFKRIKLIYHKPTKEQDIHSSYDQYADYQIISKFPDNCIFLYEENKLHPQKDIKTKFIQIEHNLVPVDYGLQDRHWNNNGRENCANTITKNIRRRLFIQ